MGRVFAYSPGDQGSILGRILPKTQELYLLSSQLYPIYPTPPLGQDMTQAQFLSGVE